MIAAAAIIDPYATRPIGFIMAGGYLFELPIPNCQLPTTPNSQPPIGVLGVELSVVGSWYLGIGSSAPNAAERSVRRHRHHRRRSRSRPVTRCSHPNCR